MLLQDHSDNIHRLVTEHYTVLYCVMQTHQSEVNVDREGVHDSNFNGSGTNNSGTLFVEEVLYRQPGEVTRCVTPECPEHATATWGYV